jgi:predicted DNA-binding transcriptional regulator AlpA
MSAEEAPRSTVSRSAETRLRTRTTRSRVLNTTTSGSGREHSRRVRALVGIDEAAVLLGEDRSTLYRSIKRGDFPLPVVTINGRMRVPRRMIEELMTGAPSGIALALNQSPVVSPSPPKVDRRGQRPADPRN